MRLWPFRKKTVSPVPKRGWSRIIGEPFSGAWQRDIEWSRDDVLAHHAVYACISLISSDIGKLHARLVERTSFGTWQSIRSPLISKVLASPNRYQNPMQFQEWWITSKLITGNAYILKERNGAGMVRALYVLDPQRVQPLVADDGSVFYRLNADNLSGVEGEGITVPASEIIHDRMNCIFHPLVGTSPIFASGASANQSLEIQKNQSNFFANASRPAGILTAPGAISEETAKRLQKHWNEKYSGENSGKVAIVGDGLEYKPMRMTAVDSQLIEQLQWTAKVVCSTFHVPGYMIGIEGPPNYNNIEALSQQYYAQCLQNLIQSWELCMTEGLGLPKNRAIELDLDGLLRMDTATQYKTFADGIGAGFLAPNEARQRVNLPPATGGDTPYLQQQNYSLEALASRDSADDEVQNALREVKQRLENVNV